MDIVLYSNNSDTKVLNKSLTALGTITGVRLKEYTSIIAPVLLLTKSADVIAANYVYIPEFGRYYYITNLEYQTNDLVSLTLAVDVLYSFRAAILASEITAIRSSNKYNRYLPDDRQATLTTSIVQTKLFTTTPFNPAGLTSQSRSFILHMVAAPS